MAVATVEDVAVALGRPISEQAEQDQVDWWLTGLELIIRGRLGDVALLDPDVLLYVETEAVASKVRRGARSESRITVAVDDASVSRYYDSPVTASDITDELWSLLAPDSSQASASIRPGFDPDTVQWAVNTPPSPYLDSIWTTGP